MINKEFIDMVLNSVPEDEKNMMTEFMNKLHSNRVLILDEKEKQNNNVKLTAAEQLKIMNIWAATCLEEFIQVMNIINPSKIPAILMLAMTTYNIDSALFDADKPTTTTTDTTSTITNTKTNDKRNKLH